MSDTQEDIVRTFMTALETNDQDTAASYLREDFTFSGWTPQPLNKKDFLTVMGGIKSGIPGLIFNLHNVDEQEDAVTGTMQIAGYQTDSFVLPPLGLPPIPQTANSVSLPAENVKFLLGNNQITHMIVQHVAGGGINGLLRQLGISVDVSQ
ncbi:MAG: nuclear transport factor 2 family protein [Ktedonobacteraceae bacterium]|nr:nuclear transport factor 2 family protein [Ktedonobacteraceae bacterium]